MCAAVPRREESDEESESECLIRANPRFSRHKNSIVATSLPTFRLRPRRRSPSGSSDDFITEEDETQQTPEPQQWIEPPIPDLLCGVPVSDSKNHKGKLLISQKKLRVKSVHFKVPVWEQIPEGEDENLKGSTRRPKKTKGVIKRISASQHVARQTEVNPCPKYAQVTEVDESLFKNSQIVRWKLKWRRVRDKFIFLAMLLIIILFLSPILRIIIF